ncbi:LacI family DNA-binding transcriptional regulator [Schaalia odontolytica]
MVDVAELVGVSHQTVSRVVNARGVCRLGRASACRAPSVLP